MALREFDAEGLYKAAAGKYAVTANTYRGLAVKESLIAREMRLQAEEALRKAGELKQIPLVGGMLAKVALASADANAREAEAMAERSKMTRAKAKELIEEGRQALDESYRSRARKI